MFDKLKSLSHKTEEVPKARSLKELYALYGYQPPATPFHDKYVLDFQWTIEERETMSDTLKKALDGNLNLIGVTPAKKVEFANGMSFQAFYSSRQNVESEIEIKFFDADKTEVAALLCKMDTTNKWAIGKKDDWILRHRLVSEKYRGQNIGSEMLKILEEGITHIAQKEKRTQILTVEARQLGVINFAFKNGFKLASNKDKQKLDLVYGGDKSKVLIATVPPIGDDRYSRPGFIYSMEEIQDRARTLRNKSLNPKEVWNTELKYFFPGMVREYFEDALTIRFKKEKKPEPLVS